MMAQDSDIIEPGAKYTVGIVQIHPFIDGSKRTGFVVGLPSLELNSYHFTARAAAAAEAVLELAADTIGEKRFLRIPACPRNQRRGISNAV